MEQPNITSEKKYNWKLFFILLGGVIFGLFSVIPYTLTLQSEQLKTIELPMPLELIIIIQLFINILFLGLITGLGLYLGSKYNLGLPIVEKVLKKEKVKSNLKYVFPMAVIIGIIASLIIIGLDKWIFDLNKYLTQFDINIPESVQPAPWKGFLASFYGGITEEVLLRLFLLSFIVWIGMFITRNKTDMPSLTMLWFANIIAAIIFGIGHLPATVAIGTPLDIFVISRAIVLNGIGGIAFGWLYFTYGLESAMIAHFSADIVIHVIF